MKYFFYIIISIFLFACAEEDPDLVNPPPQNESIRVRFFNLSGNKKATSLVLDGKSTYGPVDYGLCSSADKPPSDSSYATIIQDGQEVYRLNRKIRFTRNNFYTVFALPSIDNDTLPYRDVDTVVVASTLSGLIVKESFSYLRIINTIPKSDRNYSLRLGCPNGDALASNVRYRSISPQVEVPSGVTPVSILRTENFANEFLGLFNLNLEEKKQYLIVVLPSDDGKETFYLLDEFNQEYHPLTPLVKEDNLTTSIRAINLSESAVNFIKYPDPTLTNALFQSLSPKSIGDYVSVSACGGATLDTLACMVGLDTASSLTASLNVSEKYTILTFDSANSKAKTTVLAEPSRIQSSTNAVVRVVNASYNYDQLIVSMAARDDNPYSQSEDSLGYRSGDLISEKIGYGKISKPKLILPGNNLPITVFTTTEPANLVYTTIADFKSGGRYLLLITNDYLSGKTKLYLVEEDDNSSTSLEALSDGVFMQFVNLLPGVKQLHLSLEPVLTKAKMNYGASVATIVSEGTHKLSVNGKDTILNLSSDKRCLFVFAGNVTKDETIIDILPFVYSPIDVSTEYYQRRFINASKEVEFISVKENKETTPPIAESIKYGSVTSLQKITLARNLSLFFVKTEGDTTLYRVDDMPFPFGKNYTIIFGGRGSDNSYSVVVQQEY